LADTLYEAMVMLGADVTDLTNGISQAIDAVNNLTNQLQTSADAMNTAAGGDDELNNSMSESVAVGAIMAETILTIGEHLLDLGKDAIDAASNMQQMTDNMDVFTGNAQTTQENISNLKETFGSTGWDIGGLANTEDKMLAMGYSSEQARKTIDAVGAAVFTLGGSSSNVGAIVNQLDRMKESGQVSVGNMNMLVRQGIPAWDILANKLGVTVPQAMDMVKHHTVDASKVVDDLVAGMNDKFGPRLAKNAETFSGAMNEAKEKFENLLKSAASPLLPALADLFKQLVTVMESPGVQAFVKAIGEDLVVALKVLTPVLGVVFGILGFLLGLFAQLPGPVQQVIAGIIMLTAVWAAWQALMKIEMFAKLAEGIMGLIEPITGWIAETWAQVTANLALDASMLPVIAVILIVIAVVGLVILIVTHWGQISAWLIDQWKKVQAWWGDFVKWLTDTWNSFVSWFNSKVNDLANFFIEKWNDIKNFATNVWNFLRDHAKEIFLAIATVIFGPTVLIVAFIISHWTQIKDFLTTIWNDIQRVFAIAANLIRDIVNNWLLLVHGLITGNMYAIEAFFRSVWDSIMGALRAFANMFPEPIRTALNNIISFIRGIGNSIIDAMTAPFQAASNIIHSIIGGIQGAIGGLQGAVSGIQGAMSNVGNAAHALHVPGFAGGVINYGGGLAMVGESGPELLFLPSGSSVLSSSSTAALTSGRGSAFNPTGMGGQTIVLQVDGRDIAKALGSHMASEIRLQLGVR